MNLKEYRNSQKPPTHAQKKEPSLRKGESCYLFSEILQTERTFFRPAASKVARLFCQVPGGFARRLCLLLASRYVEIDNIKTPLDMTTLNLDLSITGDDWCISTSCLEETTVLKLSRKTFLATEQSCENLREIKLKFKRYPLFLPFLPLQPSQTRRRQRNKMGLKETNRVRYL